MSHLGVFFYAELQRREGGGNKYTTDASGMSQFNGKGRIMSWHVETLKRGSAPGKKKKIK